MSICNCLSQPLVQWSLLECQTNACLGRLTARAHTPRGQTPILLLTFSYRDEVPHVLTADLGKVLHYYNLLRQFIQEVSYHK